MWGWRCSKVGPLLRPVSPAVFPEVRMGITSSTSLGNLCFSWLPSRSDPAPMTAPVLFGMNSSSSQLLVLLQALRLGQFYLFFPHLLQGYP